MKYKKLSFWVVVPYEENRRLWTLKYVWEGSAENVESGILFQ